MKRKLLLMGVLLGVLLAQADEPLYSVRSRDQGIKDFDISATEIKRSERVSLLKVPGFQSRSAAASRWLMCVYSDLAVHRGFKMWAVVYPSPPSDELLVGFPRSKDEKIAETLGKEFGGKYVLGPIEVDGLAPLCGSGMTGKK